MKTIQFMKDILKLENELLKKMRRSEKKNVLHRILWSVLKVHSQVWDDFWQLKAL